MKQIALRAAEIARQLQERTGRSPRVGVVLGSGWGAAADVLSEQQIISYDALDGVPQ